MKDYPFLPNRNFKKSDMAGQKEPHWAFQVVCPICGFEYVHIGTPEKEAGNDNYETTAPQRGDLLKIPFSCENGHEWQMCFAFHKGYTFVFSRDPRADASQ